MSFYHYICSNEKERQNRIRNLYTCCLGCSCINDFYRMLIKEQIKKFIEVQNVEILNDGSYHFLKVPSLELPICVINSTKYAYGNKEFIKTISTLHSVPKALVIEVFNEWVQSQFNNELKGVIFLGSPIYKFIANLEIPFPN